MHILRCMGSKFCVQFQSAHLKFRTKCWTHTPQNMHFTVFYFCLFVWRYLWIVTSWALVRRAQNSYNWSQRFAAIRSYVETFTYTYIVLWLYQLFGTSAVVAHVQFRSAWKMQNQILPGFETEQVRAKSLMNTGPSFQNNAPESLKSLWHSNAI